jgi:stearoyl-CoA desaturase (delta-9 desaturase)
MYIRILSVFGMAEVKKLAPRIRVDRQKTVVDAETLRAVLGNRMQVLSQFARRVTKPVTKEALCDSAESCRRKYRSVRKALMRDEASLDDRSRERLLRLLEESQTLATVHQFQQRLQGLWERTAISQESRLKALQDWIGQAETSGVDALQHFARQLRGYTLNPGR